MEYWGCVSHSHFFLYLTFQTGNLVRVSAIVTQLVFEHALRIRVKAESPSSTRTTPAVTPETRSEMPTPDNVSVADDNAPETASGSGEENGQSTTSLGIKGKQKEEFPSGLISDDDSEDPGKASNLVGKMNNLVSTDLENIVEGRDFLLLSPSFVSHLSNTSNDSSRCAQFYTLPFSLSYAFGSYTTSLAGVHLSGPLRWPSSFLFPASSQTESRRPKKRL